MSDLGWIKLHRQILDSQVFQNEGLFKVFGWMLLKANHAEAWVPIKTGRGIQEVHVKAGQFIFGRHSAAKELKMAPSTIWKRMQKLKNMQNCDIESNSHYSIITIIKWDSYQSENKKSDSKSDSQGTAREHKQECKEIIIYLNQISGRDIKHIDSHYKFIRARLNDGHSIDDCKLVVSHKFNDPGFDQKYFRPSTLFQASKFDGYLADARENQKPIIEKVFTDDPV